MSHEPLDEPLERDWKLEEEAITVLRAGSLSRHGKAFLAMTLQGQTRGKPSTSIQYVTPKRGLMLETASTSEL